MAGVGVLSIIFGIFRADAFYGGEGVGLTALDWVVILVYVCAGIVVIVYAFTVAFD